MLACGRLVSLGEGAGSAILKVSVCLPLIFHREGGGADATLSKRKATYRIVMLPFPVGGGKRFTHPEVPL